jgi:parallel beta-helix repeat protein
MAGTSFDTRGVASVAWVNARGGSGTCTGTTSWTIASIALSAGNNVITVTVTDNAGRTNTAATTIVYDITNPTCTIVNPAADPYTTSTSTVDLDGTASDNIGVVSITWKNMATGGGGGGSGTNSWSITGIALIPGDNLIYVNATDAAGNKGSDTITVNLYVPPEIVRIDSNADMIAQALANGWPGDGSSGNPFVIDSYIIDATGHACGVYVGNTTLHFVLSSSTIVNANLAGVELYNVANGDLDTVTVQDNRDGLRLIGSSDITLTGVIATSNDLNGTYVNGGSGISFNDCDLTYNTWNGAYIIGATDVSFSGGSDSNNGRCGINLAGCYGTTTIDGTDVMSNLWNGITVTYTDVSITGVDAELNGWQGIYLRAASNSDVSGCTASDNSRIGIYVESSNNVAIDTNIVHGNHQSGIEAMTCTNVDISGNTVTSNLLQGIYLSASTGSVSGNDVESNTQNGIFLGSCTAGTTVSGNTVANNGYDGMYLGSCTGVVVSGVDANTNSEVTNNGWWGVEVRYGSGNQIDGVNSTLNTVGGLYLWQTASASVSDCNVSANDGNGVVATLCTVSLSMARTNASGNGLNGISVNSSAGVVLNDCDAYSNGLQGIYLKSDSGAMISNCDIKQNSQNGLYVLSCSGVTITGNNASYNTRIGIYVQSSNSATITYNNVWCNGAAYNGIEIRSCTTGSLNHNTMGGNYRGLFLYGVTGYTVTQNNFRNPIRQAYDNAAPGANNWDGNYWSTWTGSGWFYVMYPTIADHSPSATMF